MLLHIHIQYQVLVDQNNPAKSLYKKQTKSSSPTKLSTTATTQYYKSNGYDDEILSMPNLDPLSCSTSINNVILNNILVIY